MYKDTYTRDRTRVSLGHRVTTETFKYSIDISNYGTKNNES